MKTESYSAQLHSPVRKAYMDVCILISTACLCCGFLLPVMGQWEPSLPEPEMILCAVISLIPVYAVSTKKISARTLLICAVLSLGGLFFFFQIPSLVSAALPHLKLAGTALLISALSLAALQRLWLHTPCVLCQTVFLIVCRFQDLPVSKWYICIVLFSFLYLLASLSSCLSAKHHTSDTVYLVPFLLCAILLLQFLPVSTTPVRWNTVKSAWSYVAGLFAGNSDAYSISFSGYTEGGFLSGGVLTSNLPQLVIKGYRTKHPLYLAGTVYDTFDGHAWTPASDTPSEDRENFRLKYEQLLSSLQQSDLTEEEIKSLLTSHPYHIEYSGLRTKSIFLAPYSSQLQLSLDKDTEVFGSDMLKMKKTKKKGFSYNLVFAEFDYQSEAAIRFLRGEAFSDPPVFDEKTANREKEIYNSCLTLPDTFPARIFELAEEITAGCENDYDRLKAIENYLSAFTYTRMPPQCPKDRNLVDYFLFESNSGYCTYFATAMAVLGRCEGIPTRYVEGFVSNGACVYNTRDLTLTGKNAHAWVEAYLDGIGWVPFEPTPPYRRTETVSASAPSTGGRSLPASAGQFPSVSQPEVSVSADSAASDSDQGSSLSLLPVLQSILFLFLLVLFCTACIFLRRSLLLYRYNRQDNYTKIQSQFTRILHFGKLFKFPLEEGETLGAYAERLSGCLDTSDCLFTDICTLYQRIRFTDQFPSDEDVAAAAAYTAALEKQYLHTCRRLYKVLYLAGLL